MSTWHVDGNDKEKMFTVDTVYYEQTLKIDGEVTDDEVTKASPKEVEEVRL